MCVHQENDSNKIEATEKGSTEYNTEKEAADSGEKDSDSNNLSNHSSPNKTAQLVNEIMEKEELKLALDADNEKDSDKQSDNEESTKQSIKPYVNARPARPGHLHNSRHGRDPKLPCFNNHRNKPLHSQQKTSFIFSLPRFIPQG